jgi:hypothetical protein
LSTANLNLNNGIRTGVLIRRPTVLEILRPELCRAGQLVLDFNSARHHWQHIEIVSDGTIEESPENPGRSRHFLDLAPRCGHHALGRVLFDAAWVR